jgi:hypothetical protein
MASASSNCERLDVDDFESNQRKPDKRIAAVILLGLHLYLDPSFGVTSIVVALGVLQVHTAASSLVLARLSSANHCALCAHGISVSVFGFV